ncbi:hypothetical protein BpHYR1_033619 [Brachionus plicatilis]|uniref:DUF4485 domain-containing protein n=1 Tax=Brachionus plicatilis TaxID=10195 RepID=A0A3M7SYY2_BRAPC|nr:hypothetical protein BpHYR1_033619 [Brachionus plicatilis]
MSKSIDIDFTPLHPPETSQINQMDSDFDQHLADMKKYILELREKKTKQLCALWIKKLCEISDSGDFSSKNIRNMYSARLLSILENCDALQYPFNERPPNEALRPLDELEMKSARSHIETSRSVHHNSNSVHTDTAALKNLGIFKPDMDLYSLKHDYSHEIDQYASTFNQNSFISRIQEERSQRSSVI